MRPGYLPAFWVAHVPAMPDLKSGNYHEALKMSFLLVRDEASKPSEEEYLEEVVSKTAAPHVNEGRMRTSFSGGSAEEKWLPSFFKAMAKSEEAMASQDEVCISLSVKNNAHVSSAVVRLPYGHTAGKGQLVVGIFCFKIN